MQQIIRKKHDDTDDSRRMTVNPNNVPKMAKRNEFKRQKITKMKRRKNKPTDAKKCEQQIPLIRQTLKPGVHQNFPFKLWPNGSRWSNTFRC